MPFTLATSVSVARSGEAQREQVPDVVERAGDAVEALRRIVEAEDLERVERTDRRDPRRLPPRAHRVVRQPPANPEPARAHRRQHVATVGEPGGVHDARERPEPEARVPAAHLGAALDEHHPELGVLKLEDGVDELADYDQHPADSATDTFEQEQDLSILDALEAELAEIEAAIGRIEDGTYGVDEDTGAPIDPARLEALPQARTNVERPPR
jgi:RNA polymerase-binding transcription factor DksA